MMFRTFVFRMLQCIPLAFVSNVCVYDFPHNIIIWSDALPLPCVRLNVYIPFISAMLYVH